jgi:hypothetical protein
LSANVLFLQILQSTLTLPEEDESIFFPGSRRIFGWIALAEMMDSCYMNPHGTSSFLSPWNLARQEENDAALPDSSLKKTQPSLPIALIWNSVISHKSQVDNSSERFGNTYPAFCTWQLQSFDVFPAIRQHADDDDHKSISFPPPKAVFSSGKGL